MTVPGISADEKDALHSTALLAAVLMQNRMGCPLCSSMCVTQGECRFEWHFSSNI